MAIFKVFLFLSSAALQYSVAKSVILRTVNPTSLVSWSLSLVFLYLAFPNIRPVPKKTLVNQSQSLWIQLSALAVILMAILIRIHNMTDTSHFHYDEYLTGYFSYFLPDVSHLNWFAVYPAKDQWVSQFPLLFFLFQKLFLTILGISTFSLRLSIIPYVIITFTILFLLSKELFSRRIAFIAVAFLSFFAPDLYLTSMGLHFISSTAFFLLAFYLLMRSIREGQKWQFGVFGLILGFNYLTYYSSYLSAPIFFLLLMTFWARGEIRRENLSNLLLSFGIFIYVLAPTLTYAFKIDNYLFQRTAQVSLFTGEWSPYYKENIRPNDWLKIIYNQSREITKSFYTDGIGGHGGYNFGRLSFFDPLTFFIFLTGLMILFWKLVVKKDFSALAVLLIIFFSFFAGMVFTILPPAFHRFSLGFPFIAIVIAIALDGIYSLLARRFGQKVPYLLCLSILIFLLFNNWQRFQKIINIEKNDKRKIEYDFLMIDKDLREQNDGTVYISAFSSYALGKVLYVRFNGEKSFVTDYPQIISSKMPHDRTSLLILHNPDSNHQKLIQDEFPKIQVLRIYENHMLLRVSPK